MLESSCQIKYIFILTRFSTLCSSHFKLEKGQLWNLSKWPGVGGCLLCSRQLPTSVPSRWQTERHLSLGQTEILPVRGIPFHLKACLTTRCVKSGEISLAMSFHGLIYLFALLFEPMLLSTYDARKKWDKFLLGVPSLLPKAGTSFACTPALSKSVPRAALQFWLVFLGVSCLVYWWSVPSLFL